MRWLETIRIRIGSNAERVCLYFGVPLTAGLALIVASVALHLPILTTIGFVVFVFAAASLLVLVLVTILDNKHKGKYTRL